MAPFPLNSNNNGNQQRGSYGSVSDRFSEDGKSYDFQKLHEITRVITRNLNKVIDINYYPVPEAENSNMRHRPIGIGVQGLADTFIKLRMPFTSDEAKALNQDIFETLYYAAVTASMEEAKADGPYKTYKGSPISKGEFQHNLWNIKDEELSVAGTGVNFARISKSTACETLCW